MLQSIRINGFRKYKDLYIDGFGKINFILGENNVGKTSVLEAIYAWACGQNVFPFLNIPLARGRYSANQNPYWMMEEILATVNDRYSLPLKMSFEGIWDEETVRFNHTIYPSDLLTEYDSSYKNFSDKVISRTNDSVTKESPAFITGLPGLVQWTPAVIARWEVQYNADIMATDLAVPLVQGTNIKPYKLAKFIDVLSHAAIAENVQIYASLKREKLLDTVVEEISKVFPEIIGFDMIPYPDGSQAPVSVIKRDGSMLPMYAYGDGVQRWFYILGALALYKNSIICIDEIDSGFHPVAQVKFCLNLVQNALKNGVQLFVTTHNIEFMDSFLSAVSQMDNLLAEQIRIITVKDAEDGIKVRNINAARANNARDNYNMELR